MPLSQLFLLFWAIQTGNSRNKRQDREMANLGVVDQYQSLLACSGGQYKQTGLIMFLSVDNNQSMQQRKALRPKRQSKASLAPSHLGQRISTLAANRSQDTKSRIHHPRDSYLKDFRKPKPLLKLQNHSSIGSTTIEQQIKNQISQVESILLQCHQKLAEHKLVHSDKQQMIQLEEIIKQKDETIKVLGTEIESLKKNDRVINEEDSQSSDGKRATESSEKEKMFKLAEEMKSQRRELEKMMGDHQEKHIGYLKIKKMIDGIEVKYTQKINGKMTKDQSYRGPPLITYQEYKDKVKTEREVNIQAKAKRVVDFYHHLSPQKQANPSMNMKDLITRKNITMAALKNSKKKHNVEISEYIAKLDFLKDQDAHLTQKIKEKEQELVNMEWKFSQKKGEKNKFERNPLIHFHS